MNCPWVWLKLEAEKLRAQPEWSKLDRISKKGAMVDRYERIIEQLGYYEAFSGIQVFRQIATPRLNRRPSLTLI